MDTFLIEQRERIQTKTNPETEKNSSLPVNASSSFEEKSENPSEKFEG